MRGCGCHSNWIPTTPQRRTFAVGLQGPNLRFPEVSTFRPQGKERGFIPPDRTRDVRLRQGQNVVRFKAPREVSGRGRIGGPLRPQAVEIVFVLTAHFQVLQSNPTGQDVAGEVQDVITFVIGQMDFEYRFNRGGKRPTTSGGMVGPRRASI